MCPAATKASGCLCEYEKITCFENDIGENTCRQDFDHVFSIRGDRGVDNTACRTQYPSVFGRIMVLLCGHIDGGFWRCYRDDVYCKGGFGPVDDLFGNSYRSGNRCCSQLLQSVDTDETKGGHGGLCRSLAETPRA